MNIGYPALGIVAALALAGCGSTGTTPPPGGGGAVPPPPPVVPPEQPGGPQLPPGTPTGDNDPFGYNRPILSLLTEETEFQGYVSALNVQENPNDPEDIELIYSAAPLSLSASLSGPRPDGVATVTVAGYSYDVPISHEYNGTNWTTILGHLEKPLSVITAQTLDGNGNPTDERYHFYTYDYVVALEYYSGGNPNHRYFLYGGYETPEGQLPEQSANYDGFYMLSNNQHGLFTATADFTDETVGFFLYRMENGDFIELGNGAGIIDGSNFSSSFNVNVGGWAFDGNVDGAFFGPNADEIGGAISGATINNNIPVVGVLAGYGVD